MYLFDLKSGKKKLAYGRSPEDALEILRSRLSDSEMEEVLPHQYVKINQRMLASYIDALG
jgi:hypothetical protein